MKMNNNKKGTLKAARKDVETLSREDLLTSADPFAITTLSKTLTHDSPDHLGTRASAGKCS